MKDHSNGYYAKVVELITKIEEEQYDNIRAAGQLMAEAIKNDRLIHVYGGGGHTTLPVIGIPIKSSTFDGLDALLATVQMPTGIPVATVAVNGAENAAILAAQMMAINDPELAETLLKAKEDMIEKVQEKDKKITAEVEAL